MDGARPKCILCHVNFDSIRLLLHHMKIKHPKEDLVVVITKEDSTIKKKIIEASSNSKFSKTFKCDICVKTFLNAASKLAHVKNVHVGYLQSIRPKESLLIETECELCKKQFVNKLVLMNHVIREHGTDIKRICQTCQKACNSEYLFRIHICKDSLNNQKRIETFKEKVADKDIIDYDQVNDETKSSMIDLMVPVQADIQVEEGIQIDEIISEPSETITEKNNDKENNETLQDIENVEDFVSDVMQEDEPEIVQNLSKSAIFKCDICVKIFVSKEKFESHTCAAYGDLQCEFDRCSDVYHSEYELECHMRNYHFMSWRKSQKALNHFGKKKHFKCDKCEKTYSYKNALKEHQEHCNPNGVTDLSGQIVPPLDQGKVLGKCDICEREFSSVEETGYHSHQCATAEGTFICEYERCAKPFKDKSGLEKHMKGFHGHDIKFIDFRKRYRCDVCNKGFSYVGSLKDHRVRTHGDAPIQAFYCEYCEKTYKSNKNLKDHIRSHHTNDKIKEFKCDECGKRFEKQSTLKLHLDYFHRKSTKVKQFVCETCDKPFDSQDHLKIHMEKMQHSQKDQPKLKAKGGKIPCQRTPCTKTFANTQNMISHMKYVHDNTKSFICELCSKGFKDSYNYKRHFHLVHST